MPDTVSHKSSNINWNDTTNQINLILASVYGQITNLMLTCGQVLAL